MLAYLDHYQNICYFNLKEGKESNLGNLKSQTGLIYKSPVSVNITSTGKEIIVTDKSNPPAIISTSDGSFVGFLQQLTEEEVRKINHEFVNAVKNGNLDGINTNLNTGMVVVPKDIMVSAVKGGEQTIELLTKLRYYYPQSFKNVSLFKSTNKYSADLGMSPFEWAVKTNNDKVLMALKRTGLGSFRMLLESDNLQKIKMEPQIGHQVSMVKFSADGKLAASLGRDNSLLVWDVQNNKIIKRFTGFQAGSD